MEKSTLNELKNLTKNAKKVGEVCSSLEDLPLSLFLTMRIQGAFWNRIDPQGLSKILSDIKEAKT